jgi:ribosomal protein L15
MRKSYNPINVGDLDNSIETFIKSGAAEKKADGYEVDFTKTQFNKLLGKGDTSNKLIITVDSASTKAKDKIEKAGGKLNLLSEAEKDSEDKSDDSDNPSSN